MQLPITGYSADVLRAPVFSADIDASGLGVNTVVAGVPGKRIVVLRYKRVASNTVGVAWESSGGAVLDGPCLLAPSGGEAEPFVSSVSTGSFVVTTGGTGLVISTAYKWWYHCF